MERLKLLKRSRLHRLVEAGLSAPLVILAAPVGYGKSICARQALKGKKYDAVWVCPDCHADGASLCEAVKNAAQRAVSSVSCRPNGQEPQTSRNDTGAPARPVLVFDAAGAVYTAAAWETLYTLAGRFPDISVLCLTRVLPPDVPPLAVVINAEELAFSDDEARDFLRLNDIRLNEYSFSELLRTTEGWPGLISMAGVSWLNTGRVDYAGALRLCRASVYERLETEKQLLLQPLALLSGFTAAQAAAVSGGESAGLVLEELRRQSGLAGRDAKGGYRLHPLIRRVLAQALEANRQRLPEACGRCGDLRLREGRHAEACGWYMRAGKTRAALALLEMDGDLLFDMERSVPGRLLAAVRTDEWALYPAAYLRCIFQKLLQMDMGLCTRELERARVLLHSLAGHPRHRQLTEELSRMTVLRDGLADTGRETEAALFHTDYIRNPVLLPCVIRRCGDFLDTVRLLEAALEKTDLLSAGLAKSFRDVLWAVYYFQTGKLSQAAARARAATDGRRSSPPDDFSVVCHCILSRIARLEGKNMQQKAAAILKLKQEGDMPRCPSLASDIAFARCFLHRVGMPENGDSRGDRYQLEEEWIRAGGDPRGLNRYPYVFLGSCFYGRNNPAYLESAGEKLLEQAAGGRFVFGVIQAHLYLAAAKLKSRDTRGAERALHKAVDAARKDYITAPLLEYALTLRPLWNSLDAADAFEGELLLRCRALIKQEKDPGLPSLTLREMTILGLMADGFKQNEMAQKLHISLSTVKSYLRSIYGKLGVGSRAEALKIYRKVTPRCQ